MMQTPGRFTPIIAGVRTPARGRRPAHLTVVDRDYETLRTDMNTLFEHLAITTQTAIAA